MTCIGNTVAEINSEHTEVDSASVAIDWRLRGADITGPNHYLQISGSAQAANNWAENWLRMKFTF